MSFSAACEAQVDLMVSICLTKVMPLLQSLVTEPLKLANERVPPQPVQTGCGERALSGIDIFQMLWQGLNRLRKKA
jgi:hypothetical protein